MGLSPKYISKFNAKFAVAPKRKSDLHKKLNKTIKEKLPQIFLIQDQRKVNNDYTIMFKKNFFQLDREQTTTVYKKDTVIVEEHLNGIITINSDIINKKPDLIVSSIRIIPKSEDPYGRYQIGVTVKNIGESNSSLNSVLGLIYGTNHADIKVCELGNCTGKANIYNAEIYMNVLGKKTLASGEEYEIIFNKQNYLLDDIEFEQGIEYTFKAIVDDESHIIESNENNNIYTAGIVPIVNEILDFNIKFSLNPEIITRESIKVYWDISSKAEICSLIYSNDKTLHTRSVIHGELIKDSSSENSNHFNYMAEFTDMSGNIYYKVNCLFDDESYESEVNFINTEITQINNNASNLFQNKLDKILTELNQLRDIVKEQQTQIKYLTKLKKDVKALSKTVESAINNFITYGVDNNTKKLGAGERAAVMHSFKSAFNKLPETEEELADAIKIASGRWPSSRSKIAEKQAKKQFQKIYKRIANMDNANDNAAITIMAYGLRQKAENRNLESERTGIKTFQNIYGYHPKTTEDWNIMQSITYSGSSRGIDTDGDLLTDKREKELGTDPNNPDTDGDGHLDGVEVANGFDPLVK